MKQVLQAAKGGRTRVADVPAPALRPGCVLVRTRWSLISAGTERLVIELAGKSLVGKAVARPDLVKKTPGTAQALATAIVRANQWLQTASPSDVAKSVPESFLLGDKAIYEKAFTNVRDTISPDGIMPPDGPPNCLKFLAEGDSKIVPAQIKLADTWTNEFAQRAGKRS